MVSWTWVILLVRTFNLFIIIYVCACVCVCVCVCVCIYIYIYIYIYSPYCSCFCYFHAQNAKYPFFLCIIQGPANKSLGCGTCHGNFHDCPGHYGYLNLALPVFNVGYLASIVEILKCICKVYKCFICALWILVFP